MEVVTPVVVKVWLLISVVNVEILTPVFVIKVRHPHVEERLLLGIYDICIS